MDLNELLKKLTVKELETFRKAIIRRPKEKTFKNIQPTDGQLPIPPSLNDSEVGDLFKRINRCTEEHILSEISRKGSFHFVLFNLTDIYFKKKANGSIFVSIKKGWFH